jgi:hypothetical protein
LNQNDPTNSALAAIASIFGPSRRVPAEDAAASTAGDTATGNAEEEAAAPQGESGTAAEQPVAAASADGVSDDDQARTEQPNEGQPDEGQSEQDSNAEQDSAEAPQQADAEPPPETLTEPHTEPHGESGEQPDELVTAPAAAPDAEPISDEMIEGYSRSGPGPLDSLRFKWTARRGDDGEFYVDETIGLASRPISTGPMARDEVIAFIDERARQSQERFDALRNEMIRPSAQRQYADADADSEG